MSQSEESTVLSYLRKYGLSEAADQLEGRLQQEGKIGYDEKAAAAGKRKHDDLTDDGVFAPVLPAAPEAHTFRPAATFTGEEFNVVSICSCRVPFFTT